MASAWAQLSKEDQAAFETQGYTKKTYNDKYGKGGEPAPTPAPAPTPTPTPSAQDLINKYTPNAAAASQQEAVERSQSWADLSKDEKKALQEDDPSVTKKSYNQSTGYRAEEIAIQKQDADPLNTKYSDMSDTYRANNEKKDHKQARVDAGTYTNDRLDSYNVDSLDDFDITFTGRGRKEGENRLSVTELNNLVAAGHSKEDIANRATSGEWADAKKGTKAQALLDSWIAEFTPDPTPTPDPTDPIDPVEPTPTPGPTPNPTPTPVPSDPDVPIGTGPIEQENEQTITNEDIQNTEIIDSFNGGTIGDVTQGGTINGNNNTINNTVDNSNNSRYYGGDNTVWNINNSNQSANTGFALGGGNYTGGVTTPLSDLTMLGYGKPSDSPSANAQFVDMYQTMNADAQKKYENYGSDTANKYIQMARANNPVNYEGIQKTLSGYYNDQGELVPGTAQSFYDKAVARQTQFMGDYANFRPPTYNFPDPPEPIDDNLEDLAEDVMDF